MTDDGVDAPSRPKKAARPGMCRVHLSSGRNRCDLPDYVGALLSAEARKITGAKCKCLTAPKDEI